MLVLKGIFERAKRKKTSENKITFQFKTSLTRCLGLAGERALLASLMCGTPEVSMCGAPGCGSSRCCNMAYTFHLQRSSAWAVALLSLLFWGWNFGVRNPKVPQKSKVPSDMKLLRNELPENYFLGFLTCGPLRLRVQSRSRTRLRIAASIRFCFALDLKVFEKL